MIELAIATGRPLAEIERLDDADLATVLDVLQAAHARG
jgi:hypothetical protein